jgi:hypothetical protein
VGAGIFAFAQTLDMGALVKWENAIPQTGA